MGEKKVNLKDIAKRARVALSTVDRVVNNRGGVSEKTRQKIMKLVKDLNYQPNILARNLVMSSRFCFAVLLPRPDSSTRYWELPLKGVEKARNELEKYGITVEVFLYERNNKRSFQEQAAKIMNSRIDGLLLAPKFVNDVPLLLQDCNNKNIPFVFIDSSLSDKASLCNIGQPLFESGCVAGQLFRNRFDKGIVLITYIRDEMDNEEVLTEKTRGLKQYLQEQGKGITVEKLLLKTLHAPTIKRELSKAFKQLPGIKGIFVLNSKVAPIARFIEQEGKTGICLIGYDLLEEDYPFLENGTIDFLICQQPEEQTYKGIYKMFESTLLKLQPEKQIYMPIDIVMKGNYKFYSYK